LKIAETGGICWNECQPASGGGPKVLVNQDEEGKWEADRKMKMKINLLAAALVE
jgi:hypothetical protein